MTSELNIKIGKKLGYKVYRVPTKITDSPVFVLEDSDDDSVLNGTVGHRRTEEDAWDDMPDWSGDISLALELLGDRKFQLDNHNSGWTARIGDDLSFAFVGSGATAAEAICWAWTHIDLEAEKKAKDIEKLKEHISANVRELDRLVGKPVFRLVPIEYDALIQMNQTPLSRGDIALDARPEVCKASGHSWVNLVKGGGYYGCEMCGTTRTSLLDEGDARPIVINPENCITHRIIKPLSGIGGFCVDCGMVLK